MKRALFFVLVALIATSALGQGHSHSRQRHDGAPLPHRDVIYNARVEVVPDSVLVRGLLEVTFTNSSNDTLDAIHFFGGASIAIRDYTDSIRATPLPGQIIVDSVLYRGVPLDIGTELIFEGKTMTARPYGGVKPGETAFIILTFESRCARLFDAPEDLGVTFYDWFPKVSAFPDISWYMMEDLGDSVRYHLAHLATIARMQLDLTVDSAFTIACPGEIKNALRHFGPLPGKRDDTVYVDYVAQNNYRPVFSNGKRRFFVVADGIADFVFALGSDFARDLAYAGELRIETVYPRRLACEWSLVVAADAAETARCLLKRLGECPYRGITIVVSTDWNVSRCPQPIITLSGDTLCRDSLDAALTRRWLPPVQPPFANLAEGHDVAPWDCWLRLAWSWHCCSYDWAWHDIGDCPAPSPQAWIWKELADFARVHRYEYVHGHDCPRPHYRSKTSEEDTQ